MKNLFESRCSSKRQNTTVIAKKDMAASKSNFSVNVKLDTSLPVSVKKNTPVATDDNDRT